MEVKLQKWGNSCGIRIPNIILKNLNININDKLEIKEDNEKIIISKIKNNKWTIAERVEEYNNAGEVNFENDFKWDEPKGREIW